MNQNQHPPSIETKDPPFPIPAELTPTQDAIYSLSVASYPEAQRCIENQDKRLQELVVFASTLTVAAITLSAGRGLKFDSIWFLCATASYALGVIVALIARLTGTLKIVSVAALSENCMDMEDGEFKRNYIRNAAKNGEANHRLVVRKWRCAAGAAICFLIEVGFLIFWATGGFRS